MNLQRTCSPGVRRRAPSRSLQGGSYLVLFLLLSGTFLSIAPTAIAQSVRLTWTASTSVIGGYNVYRGKQSGGPYTMVNPSLVTTATYSDASVQAGQSYYYVATAVNSSNVESAYSNEAQVYVPYSVVSSQLSFTPASVSFATVYVGSSSSQTVTLTDTGSASVVVSGETVTGTGFSTSGLSVPLTLAGGQSATFTVTFAPAAAGSATGIVSVVSNASNSPTLSLAGTGVSLLLSASPASLSFGNVTVGSKSSHTVTLTNSGTASLSVSQAAITGTGFSISGLSLPLSLAAGQNATFKATFAPTTTGSVTGSLSVVSNATNSPATVSLSGTGVRRHH